MRPFILAISLLVFSFNSFANKELAASMKIIGEQFKVIVGGVQANNFTSTEFDAIKVLQKAITDSAAQMPDTAITSDQQKQYMLWMNELMTLSLTLEAQAEVAMTASPQDLTEVIKTLRAMDDLRKQGHADFKEEE